MYSPPRRRAGTVIFNYKLANRLISQLQRDSKELELFFRTYQRAYLRFRKNYLKIFQIVDDGNAPLNPQPTDRQLDILIHIADELSFKELLTDPVWFLKKYNSFAVEATDRLVSYLNKIKRLKKIG
ncbi:hypothetical protein C4J81_09350 [Deltaproteobacteria bacterium Smac51]|nr:hypothetical protein C4J81_09350 [Deltaproteobacteria bacterium Smac51]